jgi:hypothetical protein
MSEDLTVVAGTVNTLMIYDGEQEFVHSLAQRAAGVGAAAGLAAAGLAGAAVSASIAATSTGDPVQFFSCNVGNQTVAGRFSKASFKEGDELIAVVRPQRHDVGQVLAMQRPSDQMLWILLHCSRGGQAHLRFAMRLFWWVLIGFPAFGMLSYLALNTWINHNPIRMDLVQFAGAIFLVLGAIAAFYYSIRFYLQWRPAARQAESIFAALGYPDPSRVDLPRDHKRYCKAHHIQWPYLTDGAWIYHYLDPRDTSNV